MILKILFALLIYDLIKILFASVFAVTLKRNPKIASWVYKIIKE